MLNRVYNSASCCTLHGLISSKNTALCVVSLALMVSSLKNVVGHKDCCLAPTLENSCDPAAVSTSRPLETIFSGGRRTCIFGIRDPPAICWHSKSRCPNSSSTIRTSLFATMCCRPPVFGFTNSYSPQINGILGKLTGFLADFSPFGKFQAVTMSDNIDTISHWRKRSCGCLLFQVRQTTAHLRKALFRQRLFLEMGVAG